MAIRTTTIGRHRTVAGLAKALFDLKGSAISQADAEAALLRANPHLAEESGFSSGATVIVPELPGVRIAGGTAEAFAASRAVSGWVADAFEALDAFAAKAIDQSLTAAKENAERLADRRLVAAVGKERPDLLERLPEIQRAAKEDIEALAAGAEAVRKSLKRAAGELKALREPGGPTPAPPR